jgi:hypothetical protein
VPALVPRQTQARQLASQVGTSKGNETQRRKRRCRWGFLGAHGEGHGKNRAASLSSACRAIKMAGPFPVCM